MKNNIIIFLSCIVILTSCHEILNTNPTDFYTQETFWKNAAHAEQAVTGCYQALLHNDLHNSQTPFMWDCMTPNAYNYDNQNGANEYARGIHTSTWLGMNINVWRGCYRGIGRCNSVIANLPDITMDETLKKRLIGEAKFLRAFYYDKMNVVFNGVPLILNPPSIADHSQLPRESYEKVLEAVIKDLDDAISALPVSYSSGNGGRATKGAALSLKARVLLQNHKYPEVVSTIDRIFSLNQYELFPDYNGLFRKVNEGNSEIIFDVRFKAPEVTNSYDIIMAQYSTQAPLQNLVDAYQMIDGKSIKESPIYDEKKPWENRDPRFAQSILYLGAPWRNRVATEFDLHQTGYSFRKYTEYNQFTVGTLSNSETNYIIIRYADVLLMYAEALNEVNGPVQAVYNAINSIRNRPNVKMPNLTSGLSKEEMREEIRLERRIELAGEGSYFYDIRRWGLIDKVMSGPIYNSKGNVIETREFNPARDRYFPVPYTEIDLNPKLQQNPGY